MKAHAAFEVAVGIASGLLFLSMLGGMTAMSTPVSLLLVTIVWGSFFAGPILLITGPCLFLAGTRPKLGGLLTIIGSIAWTGIAVVVALSIRSDQMERGKDPWLIGVSITVLCIAAMVDWCAYVLWRFVRSAGIQART